MSTNKVTMEYAASGLDEVFEVSMEILTFIARAMDAVEAVGSLTGTAKKLAVFDMARGVVENFDKIESTLSKLVDIIKKTYNKLKEFILEVF